jgi:hypothetical protein
MFVRPSFSCHPPVCPSFSFVRSHVRPSVFFLKLQN